MSEVLVATRPVATPHRQYEVGDTIDQSRIGPAELAELLNSGAVAPPRDVGPSAAVGAAVALGG